MRITGNYIERYFTFDKYGALHPRKDALRTKDVAAKIGEMLNNDETLEYSIIKREFGTDVEFPTRPLGSTPVIANGVPNFGPSPLRKMPFEGKLGVGQEGAREQKDFLKRCAKREKKIVAYVKDAIDTAKSLPAETPAEVTLRGIEVDQAYTGGGYDNTKTWGVSKSLFHQLSGAVQEISDGSEQLSRLLMEEVMKFRENFFRQIKVPLGSLRITGFDLVRLMQDSDGMIGWPIFAKSSKTLTHELARRISMWSGVDCRWMVNSTVKGESLEGQVDRPAQVVDAMCYCLDNITASPDDVTFASIIWTLARIQRHGYKETESGELEAKDGKSRSVSPNGAFAGGPEAMTFDGLLKAMKDAEIPWMPSLQDRETADRLIWDWYEKVLVPNEMRALPLDWSKWDHHIYGWILATILYYVVRPLYHFDDQAWVDFAIVSLVFKYFFVANEATAALPEEWAEVESHPLLEIVPMPGTEFTLVGTYDYLGSGAKLTHVGGSMYGELLIHHCMPRLLGYQGYDGPQAGDDTAVAVPIKMIDLTSADATFKPIVEAAAIFGLEMNASKQIWAIGEGEVTNIFLQYAYNYNAGIKGVGTGSRYYVAAPFAEREKALTISEQYMAVISKFSNGVNNPWIRIWLQKWFERDKYALALFHYKGAEGFDILVDSMGSSLIEASKRLELTYNWGLKTEQLVNKDIPILPIMAEVAAGMSPKVTLDEALKHLDLQGKTPSTDYVDEIIEDADVDDQTE